MHTQTPQMPIKAVLLSDLVQERLLADIVSGRYAPGERLNLDVIAEECGVSRMPIREALQALSMIGFVSVSRNARTVVADWSSQDMRERALVIGRLIAFLAMDKDAVAAVDSDALSHSLRSDLEVYLDLVSQMVLQRLPRLNGYMQRALIAPLRLFSQEDVLAAHGFDATARRDIRRRHLDDALHGFATGNRARVAEALTRYADELDAALTLPGPGLGSGPRNATPTPDLVTA